MKKYNAKIVPNSKTLRKNMTVEERKLWYDFLKKLPLTVNRQKVIRNYIVDFFCASKKIVIEIDGSQHYEDEGRKKDTIRNNELSRLGYSVLRYTNRDISQNFDDVCNDILNQLNIKEYL